MGGFFCCVETAGRDVCQPAIYSLAFLLTVQLCLPTLSGESTTLCKGQFTESHKNNFLLCRNSLQCLNLDELVQGISAYVSVISFSTHVFRTLPSNSYPGKYLFYLWPVGTKHQRTVDVYEEGVAEKSCYGLTTTPHSPSFCAAHGEEIEELGVKLSLGKKVRNTHCPYSTPYTEWHQRTKGKAVKIGR